MENLNRREFLKLSAILGTSAIALPSVLAACSDSNEKFNLDALSLARVSSDLYLSSLDQRFAFTIFEGRDVISAGDIDVKLIDPQNNETLLTNVKLRNTGISELGIYTLEHKFAIDGVWRIETQFQGKDLNLDFQVKEAPSAPGLGQGIPMDKTPTELDPMDAQILCTSFDGQCELHSDSVDELLVSNASFVVLFATPARCQTSYCGPVLELTRDVVKEFDIPTVHIEIYKDETSPDTLDAVKIWNLPSEPWLFAIDAQGQVTKRLDGAFDRSEIEGIYQLLSA